MNSGPSCSLIETYMRYKNGFLIYKNPSVAFVHYKNKKRNLLTGAEVASDFSSFLSLFKEIKLGSKRSQYSIFHFYYESGFYYSDQIEEVEDDAILAIELRYRDVSFQNLISTDEEFLDFNLSLFESPALNTYSNGFKRIQEHLKRGECYQVNYTFPFYYRLNKYIQPRHFLARLWNHPQKVGAYAHGTWLGPLGKLLFSNSPECLFQVKSSEDNNYALESMPIKGTLSCAGGQSLKKKWNELRSSAKECGELNMITDLVRNDLSRIEKPCAKVIRPAAPLLVPGLLHQFSKIQVNLSPEVSLHQVLSSVFPGGSITGAPKKRVMQIIKKLETGPRGFYCGSTLVLGPKICAASINIRSGVYLAPKGQLKIHAGGGITLKSREADEYAEMMAKSQSVYQGLLANERKPKFNNFSRLVF